MEVRSFKTKDKNRAAANKKQGLLRHTPGHIDFLLFAAVLCLSLFGLVMMYSASYYSGQVVYDDPFHYMPTQIGCFAAGLAAMIFIANMKNYQWLRKGAPWLYLVALALLIATLFFGGEINGAKRWIKIGVTFQPSEIAKYAMVLLMATFMAKNPNRMKSFSKGLLPMLLSVGILCVPIVFQPNMSMTLIICMMAFVMLFIGGCNLKHIAILCAVAAVGLGFVIIAEPYRLQRIFAFSDPWQDPLDSGYHTIQSLYALASGGLFGTGLNFSRQKLLFLTYAESDYIFAIIGEELGYIGALLVIAAYVFVICRGVRIAMRCRDRFGSLLAAGITIVLGIQTAVNICVTCNLMPSTGQTLPFISAGGTSLTICLAAIGILLNISKNTE